MENNHQKINLYDIYEKLGRMEGKTDGMQNDLRGLRATLSAYCEMNDRRVSELEKRQNLMMGKAAATGGIAGLFATLGALLFTLLKYFRS